MTTQAIMKARIADELSRSDLTSQIAYAIGDAITAYEDERFYFNESRTITFSTVASQEFYGSGDAASFANICKIDYVFIYLGNQPFQLLPLRPADMEASVLNGTSTGQPSWYCYYNQQMRFYPVPSDAWTVRIGAAVKVAAPASDSETANPWMTSAERLIRSRAKLELALHVLKDDELAKVMSQAVEEASDQLKSRTNLLTQDGEGRVQPMAF